ncbi:MAG TPA: TadE family protein [Phycisphaerae bacterium]|nr:TadE family protein [Phycisphaerae bacterium]
MALVKTTRRSRGAATIEAALLFPVLLFLTLALIEYGWLFLKFEETTNAARRGARLGVTPDATTGEVASAVGSLMSSAGMGESGYSVTIRPADVASLAPGEVLTVEVNVPYGNIALIGGPLVPLPGNLRASVSMAKEGP